eukprot:TRINITY_DN13426_c0_g1_i2.p1 TRINITY_DN13426_c0_g1~~TRINITY_DN13426_c0_g1_i2.p1  ORF type:complete len:115 (+),score=31.33 TRINITY_DN13426_c0_g1_i2:146-490(+)
MIRRPPRSTLSSSSAASDVYKRQVPEPPNQRGVPNVHLVLDSLEAMAEECRAKEPNDSDSAMLHEDGNVLRHKPQQRARAVKAEDRAVSYTHLRAHETPEHLVCRLLLEKKKKQ